MICAVRLMFEAHTDEEKGRRSIGGNHRAGSVTILGARLFMVGGSGRRAASTKCVSFANVFRATSPHRMTASPEKNAIAPGVRP